MRKVLVLGGDGMLGHKVFQAVRRRFAEPVCTVRGSVEQKEHLKNDLFLTSRVIQHVDGMDVSAVERVLQEEQPDVVVNAIGVIKQRLEAHAAIPCITINSLLPHRLAKLLSNWGGRLIHFSTDCVFSGKLGNYRETDHSDADDLYGKTKYLGEVAYDNSLTLRTSIIGRELSHFGSLLEWFLSQNHKSVRGFTRALYSGVTTNYLAEVVCDLIEQHSDLSGLYQVTSETISKYELLGLIRDAYRLDIDIVPDDSYFCDRSMTGNRFRQATGYVCPSWPELIRQMAADPTPYYVRR